MLVVPRLFLYCTDPEDEVNKLLWDTSNSEQHHISQNFNLHKTKSYKIINFTQRSQTNAYSSTVPFTIKLRLQEMYVQYNCLLLAPILSINLKHADFREKWTDHKMFHSSLQLSPNTFFISTKSLQITIKILKDMSVSLHVQYLLLVLNINQNWDLSVNFSNSLLSTLKKNCLLVLSLLRIENMDRQQAKQS